MKKEALEAGSIYAWIAFEFINCCWPVLKVFLVFIVEEVLDLELEVDHAGSVIHGSVEHI